MSQQRRRGRRRGLLASTVEGRAAHESERPIRETEGKRGLCVVHVGASPTFAISAHGPGETGTFVRVATLADDASVRVCESAGPNRASCLNIMCVYFLNGYLHALQGH